MVRADDKNIHSGDRMVRLIPQDRSAAVRRANAGKNLLKRALGYQSGDVVPKEKLSNAKILISEGWAVGAVGTKSQHWYKKGEDKKWSKIGLKTVLDVLRYDDNAMFKEFCSRRLASCSRGVYTLNPVRTCKCGASYCRKCSPRE